MPAKTLRAELHGLFARWRDDLPLDWRAVVGPVEPDPSAVDPELTVDAVRTVYPGRRGKPAPGAPAGAHALRPFESSRPDDVRVVVVGVDPYPAVEQATGRAFEEGGLLAWSASPQPSASPRRLLQAVAHVRRPEREDYLDEGGWAKVVADRVELGLSAPAATWDRWEMRGVLFVNAAFTATRRDPAGTRKAEDTLQKAHRERGHRPYWRPVAHAVLAGLARRPGRPLVLVAWGQEAAAVVAASGAAAAAGPRWGQDVRLVERTHPATGPKGGEAATTGRSPFLQGVNPLREINDALAAVGAGAVDW